MKIKSSRALLLPLPSCLQLLGKLSAETAVQFEMTPERREEQLLTARACELGATGTLTSLLCVHEGAGADPGLAPDLQGLQVLMSEGDLY